MSFAKSVVLLLSAFACVQALTTPHARDAHHHRALAARVAAPASNVAVPDVLPKKRDSRKRSSSKRCAARPAPSSNSTTVASSSSEAASSSVPVNVGSVPTSIFTPPAPSSTPEPTPTPTPTHTPSSSKDTQPTTTPDNTPTSSSQAPAPTSPSSGSGSGSGAAGFLAGTNSGDGTFYARKYHIRPHLYCLMLKCLS
ncbi:hypothetical protein BDP27DRAFT_746988 [Rhodocollybia butyracea]|uniref:Uncharacterized protein n=1 Tax=Rhodocollybia butyracea TaxID=206335 RepID=A0A9P5PTL1_9AGAR|nr:hypothetical protein BDP27DRAFT_746988 [Rhodocollybia butyracea]